jgi:gamma-glutamylcyclotransferase (GGCT)/AIG2-like uncharacterized protein YtfP
MQSAQSALNMPPLATYGTLMRDFQAQEQLGIGDAITFVGRCRLPGILFDLGSFPGAVPPDDLPADLRTSAPETPVVHGELYRLEEADILSVLDHYEGYDPDQPATSLFVRRRISLVEPADQDAWVYWYNGPVDGKPRLPSGDWRQRGE